MTISIGWLAVIMIAEGVLGEAVCYWRRASRRARAVIAADLAATQATRNRLALAERERDALGRLARRPYPPWVLTDGKRIADGFRKAFPDVPDDELIRVMLHARWVTGNEYANGRNVVQISHLFGAAALELAAIDVTMHGQAAR